MARRKRPSRLNFQRLSLAMKNILRSVRKMAKPKSMIERCTGAMITGPSEGILPGPSTRGEK
jgi:hypothetical protein